jgi:hypothetical protein
MTQHTSGLHRSTLGWTAAHPDTPPVFRELTPEECVALLERTYVGRIAYVLHNQVEIAPVHYVYDGGWLVGRTAEGTKLAALRHHPWVAFEVDHSEGLFDWQSVIVHGAFYALDRVGPYGERARWDHAVERLRRLVPAAFTPADPTPERDHVFRIHVGAMTGRAASTRSPGR